MAPAFKGAFNWLRQGDDVARGGCSMLRRLMGDGCFRATVGVHGIGWEFEADSIAWTSPPPMADEDASQVALAPAESSNAATMFWLSLGVGLTLQRARKHRQRNRDEHDRAEALNIDKLFASASCDDSLWT